MPTFVPMFKRFTAILLLITLIGSAFSQLFVYAGFKVNQRFIAEKLCVNRSRPWMHCDGKCYFMKKIRQAAENEKKQTEKDNLSRLEISFFQEPFRLNLISPIIMETAGNAFPAYTYQYNSHYLSAIFRPPKQQTA